MNFKVIIGIVLILAGIAGLWARVIPIHQEKEVAKIGPITATKDQENDYPIPPWASVIVMVVGGALLVTGISRR